MRRVLGACCVLAILTSVAFAQNQNQGRPPRGGGFGGGFGPGGGMQASTALLAIPEVQVELSLNDDQKKQIRELDDKVRQERQGAFNFQELRDLKEEERQKKMDEFRKKNEEVNKSTIEQIGKILDANQNERLQQLRLQREGVAAIATANIAEKLELSQEQKDKISKIQVDARQNSPFGRGGAGGAQPSDEERRAAFEKFREAREKQNADLLAVLTADQKANWEKLQGKKFDFPQGGGFGGPGGGRPGAGAPGGTPRRRPETKKDNEKKDN